MLTILDLCVFAVVRYALKDLWESEREYIKDMAFALDNYLKIFDGDLPKELQGHKDIIFANYPDVHKFHDG